MRARCVGALRTCFVWRVVLTNLKLIESGKLESAIENGNVELVTEIWETEGFNVNTQIDGDVMVTPAQHIAAVFLNTVESLLATHHHYETWYYFICCVGTPLVCWIIGFGVRLVSWAENCLKQKRWIQKYMGGGGLINCLMLIFGLSVVMLCSIFSVYLVNEEKKDHTLSQALHVTGEADHWSYFVSLYFTLQTVMTIVFGDEYVYSPAGAFLWLKPFICLVLTAFLIALFSHVFNKTQAVLDEKAQKNTVKSRETIKKLRQGVLPNSKVARNNYINDEFEDNKPVPVEGPRTEGC